MTIHVKFAILCSFLVLFTAGVLSFLEDKRVGATLEEEIIKNMTRRSQGINANITRFINSQINDIKLAAKNPYFMDSNLTSKELTSRLQEYANGRHLYHSFSLFDSSRIKIADSKNFFVDKKHPYNVFWSKLDTLETVIDVSKSVSIDQPVMHFASKIKKTDTQNGIGFLVGRVLVSQLSKIIGEFHINKDTTENLDIHIIDESGLILYSNTNPSSILTQKYEEFDMFLEVAKSGITFLETQDELFFISQEEDYLPYTGNKWSLILSIPKKNAFSPMLIIRRKMFWTVLPVLGFTIILALIFSTIFVRPIVKLSRVAEELSKGNFDVKLPISTNSKDEIGKLAKQMTQSSQSLLQQLEEQRQMNKQLLDQTTQIEIQKNQLMAVSSQIRDSISYAERIQRSTLPPISTLQKIFPKSFVIYSPKDIIGGDFYWFEKVRIRNNEYMVVACGDCTGHGVPGAIMSIMGSNQLTNIIYYQNYIDPKKIISRLDKVIKFELQKDTDDINREGMEIAICVIDLDTLKMEFSGVGIPLLLKKKDSNKLEIYKTPRKMIGGIEGDEQEVYNQLKKETIQLNMNDKIYLSSDGFQDQFGGPKDKKFLSKNFNMLLEKTSILSVADQQKKVQNTFDTWSKNTSQTDDVCVLGFEIT